LNILIVGVGGQGVILVSELLGKAAVGDGIKVRGSEILGMAVRGGSVSSVIRMGSEVYGPLIPTGKTDVLIGMETSEALRNITYLGKSSLVILNSQTIVPFTVSLGESSYPSLKIITDKLKGIARKVVMLDAIKLAAEAGNPLAANIAMLGALFGTGQMPIKIETIKDVIQTRFPASLASANAKAFDLGYKTYQALSSEI